MSFFQLCERDPLVGMMREVFGANIVRVPDARIQPLSVLVHNRGQTFFRGALAPLLSGDEPLAIAPVKTEMADISGRRSRQIKLDIGLYILGGFLNSFGITPAELEAKLGDVANLSIAFPSVQRSAVDINQLGRALSGRRIERSNAAAAIFFEESDYELLVIDSVLTSNRLSLKLTGQQNRELALDVTGLQELLGKAGAKVSIQTSPDYDITLESDRELTFAFSCVRLFLDAEGLISAMPPDLWPRMLSGKHEATVQVEYSPDRVVLHGRPGMLSWDTWVGDGGRPRLVTPLGRYMMRRAS
jgi:hypothetical protein